MSKTDHRFSTANVISAIGAVVLVASELVAAAFATGWAVSGLLRLGDTLTYAVEGVFVAAALAGSLFFARQVLKADPVFVRTAGPND